MNTDLIFKPRKTLNTRKGIEQKDRAGRATTKATKRSFMIEGTPNSNVNRQDVLLTRMQLALELKVSLRTVDMMLADGEITPIRLRGKMVRFYLPDVLQELREKAKTSKRNVARRL